MRRRRFLCAARTLPVATSNAANSRRRAVPLVVVAVPCQGAPVRQLEVALGAFERLDRRFLVKAQDDRVVGRRHVEADDICGLGGKLGVRALAPALAAAEIDLLLAQRSPDILHVDVAQCLGDQRSVPTCKACGGWRIEHRANALVGLLAVDRRRAGTRQVIEPVEPFASKASPPQADRGGGGLELTRDLTGRGPLGRLQHDPYPQQLPLLRGRGAQPSLQLRALLRLQPNLDCIRNHRHVESRCPT